MSALIDSYNLIISRVNEINDKIHKAEQQIEGFGASLSGDTNARIQKLEEQLVKIDDYLLKIKGFEELAKKNLDSQNVLTIEAPPGYRVNLNRLRNWAMMIDPTSPNDPYAQRVLIVAKCDECFLNKKQAEFKERIEMLKNGSDSGASDEIKALQNSIKTYKEELKQYAVSAEMSEFSKAVVEANDSLWNRVSPEKFVNRQTPAKVLSPGAYAAPLPFEKEERVWLKNAMGDCYDSENGRVRLPIEIDAAAEYVMTILCSPARRKKLDKALQNLILSTINGNPAGSRKLYILDGVRYNSSSIGDLRKLEETFAIEKIPRNPEQLTAALEQIVSSFADTDEILELYDSVSEYNANAEKEKKLPYTTVLLFGNLSSFEGHDRDLIQRILTNYERYGISFISVSYANSEPKDEEKRIMPEYASQNAIRVSMLKNETTITFAEGKPQRFTWYSFDGELSDEYVDGVTGTVVKKDSVGNDYTKLYPMDVLPEYVRDNKEISLPFGIDAKNQIHSLSFENENFATYLVGASRSGKSTMLHTLITGLIRNYHPDNVELWLADFKQVEFKQYIKHCPPHVKYILLDESPELVYDLIDKLTEKLLERQRLFAKLGKDKLIAIDPKSLKEPIPVIFVVFDEFSIMSQAIAESESYKLRLQNLLAKGAAFGIKFLFSSQTFTTGVAGLTPTARAQIQQRISMKGTKDEINETLELSANIRNEQIDNWIEALPPHYALVKRRISADALPEVNRVLAMYIPDYAIRDDMIDSIKESMTAIDEYRPDDIKTYKDKRPVIVDGNSYKSFENTLDGLMTIKNNSANSSEHTGDEIFLNVGTPRRMDSMIPIVIAPESRENAMLLADASEMICAASVIYSMIKSFTAQGGKVSIWAYGRDRMFRIYGDIWNKYSPAVDIDNVCDEIRDVKKKIDSSIESKELIIFFGAERICNDFELARKTNTSKDSSGIAAFSVNSLISSGAMTEQGDNEPDLFAFLGGTASEETPAVPVPAPAAPAVSETASEPEEETVETGAYNAKEDFNEILRQGSRLGYHVVTVSNSLADFKQGGLHEDLFRHRLAFKLPKDDSWDIFGSGAAVGMPEHVCRYSNMIEGYSFRPYIHKELSWDGWVVDDEGNVKNEY